MYLLEWSIITFDRVAYLYFIGDKWTIVAEVTDAVLVPVTLVNVRHLGAVILLVQKTYREVVTHVHKWKLVILKKNLLIYVILKVRGSDSFLRQYFHSISNSMQRTATTYVYKI